MKINLERAGSFGHMGTFGRVRFAGHSFVSVEREWRNNKPWVSCIPAGTYRVAERWYHRGNYGAFEIVGVEGRTDILIHRARRADQLAGCIALGTELGTHSGRWSILGRYFAFRVLCETISALEAEEPVEIAISWRSYP